MRIELVFPTVLIVLFFAAGAVHAVKRDWAAATYWIAAGVLNLAAVMMQKGQ